MAYTDIQRLIEQNRIDLMGGGNGYSDQSSPSTSASAYQDPGYSYEDPFGTNGIEPPTQEAPTVPATSSPTPDWMKKYQDYNPDTEAMGRLNALLSQAPNPEDYNAGWGRKLVAMGMAAGGPKGFDQGQKFLNTPYALAEENFKTKAVPFEAAASRENAANTNQRQFLSQMATAQTNDQKVRDAAAKASAAQAEQTRSNQAKEAIAQRRNEIIASKDLGFTYKVAGDKLIGTAPDGSTFDAGYDIKNASGIEIATILAKNRVEVAGINAQARIDAKTAEPGVNPNAPGGLLSGKDQVQARQDRFEELYNTTDLGRKWIQKDDNGKYTMKDKPVPGSMPWSDTQKEVDEWQSVANGIYTNPVVTKAQSAKRGTSGANPTPPPEAQQSTVPTKKVDQDAGVQAGSLVVVQDPSGKKYVIPANKPVPKGWTKVAR